LSKCFVLKMVYGNWKKEIIEEFSSPPWLHKNGSVRDRGMGTVLAKFKKILRMHRDSMMFHISIISNKTNTRLREGAMPFTPFTYREPNRVI